MDITKPLSDIKTLLAEGKETAESLLARIQNNNTQSLIVFEDGLEEYGCRYFYLISRSETIGVTDAIFRQKYPRAELKELYRKDKHRNIRSVWNDVIISDEYFAPEDDQITAADGFNLAQDKNILELIRAVDARLTE